MSAEARRGFPCFLDLGLGLDFLDDARRLDLGSLEGLEGGLAPPMVGRKEWMAPGERERNTIGGFDAIYLEFFSSLVLQ